MSMFCFQFDVFPCRSSTSSTMSATTSSNTRPLTFLDTHTHTESACLRLYCCARWLPLARCRLSFLAFNHQWVCSVFNSMFFPVGPRPVARCLPQHLQTQGHWHFLTHSESACLRLYCWAWWLPLARCRLSFLAFNHQWVCSVFNSMFFPVGPRPVARCLPQHLQTQGHLTFLDTLRVSVLETLLLGMVVAISTMSPVFLGFQWSMNILSVFNSMFLPTGWKPNQRFACVYHGVNGVGWGGVGR